MQSIEADIWFDFNQIFYEITLTIKRYGVKTLRCVEIHTGRFSNLVKSKSRYSRELIKISKCSKLAKKLKIEVHAGHGLDYKSTKLLSRIEEIEEFNIGHFLIGESIFNGLTKVIKNFKKIIR